MRKDAWLRELLTSSSEDGGEVGEKRARMERKYARFEESSRWIEEATCPDQKHEAQTGTEATSAEGKDSSEEGKSQGQEENCQQQPSTDEMLRILDLLDKRADVIGTRL